MTRQEALEQLLLALPDKWAERIGRFVTDPCEDAVVVYFWYADFRPLRRFISVTICGDGEMLFMARDRGLDKLVQRLLNWDQESGGWIAAMDEIEVEAGLALAESVLSSNQP